MQPAAFPAAQNNLAVKAGVSGSAGGLTGMMETGSLTLRASGYRQLCHHHRFAFAFQILPE